MVKKDFSTVIGVNGDYTVTRGSNGTEVVGSDGKRIPLWKLPDGLRRRAIEAGNKIRDRKGGFEISHRR